MRAKLIADFAESDVALNISMYLGRISAGPNDFWIRSVTQSRERLLGYDGAMLSDVREFRPLYMQFKRPFSLHHSSWAKIVRQRKQLGLNVRERSLAFELLNKKRHHHDFQHNILLELSMSEDCHAAYVCPLFTDGDRYNKIMRELSVRAVPYELIERTLWARGILLAMSDIPFLDHHVCIVPHTRIHRGGHHYSFDFDGDEVCFHSPKYLDGKNASLGAFLADALLAFRSDRNTNLKEAGNILEKISSPILNSKERSAEYDLPGSSVRYRQAVQRAIFDGEMPIYERWMIWGEYLATAFGIRQFFITRRQD